MPKRKGYQFGGSLGISSGNFQPIIRRDVGIPLQEFAGTLEGRLNDFAIAQETDDLLSDAASRIQTAPFESDKNLANDISTRFRENIEHRAIAGDFENAVRQTRRDARQFATEIAPLQQNLQAYTGYIDELNKRVTEGKITRNQAQSSLQLSLQDYEGIDPNNISGSIFRGFQPVDNVDLSQEAFDRISNWGVNEVFAGYRRTDEGFVDIVTQRFVDPNEVFNAVAQSLAVDFRDYLEQEALFGNDPDEILKNAVAPAAEKAGFTQEHHKFIQDPSFEPNAGAWEGVAHITLPSSNIPYNGNFGNGIYSEDGVVKVNKPVNETVQKGVLSFLTAGQGTIEEGQGSIVGNIASFFGELFAGKEELPPTSEQYRAVVDYLRSTGQVRATDSKEEIGAKVAQAIDERQKLTISSQMDLSTDSKFLKNFNQVFFGGGQGLNISGTSAAFNFFNQEGEVIPGAKLREYINDNRKRLRFDKDDPSSLNISYGGSIDNVNSPYEYGSSVVFVNGEQLIMSPAEEDKAREEYMVNRILSAQYAPTFTNTFDFRGNNFNTIWLETRKSFIVTDTKSGEVAEYKFNTESNSLEKNPHFKKEVLNTLF